MAKVKTLTYWYVKHLNDSDCYSIVARTKKDAIGQARHTMDADDISEDGETFELHKVEASYIDAFNLFINATSEWGGRDLGVIIKTYKIKLK